LERLRAVLQRGWAQPPSPAGLERRALPRRAVVLRVVVLAQLVRALVRQKPSRCCH